MVCRAHGKGAQAFLWTPAPAPTLSSLLGSSCAVDTGLCHLWLPSPISSYRTGPTTYTERQHKAIGNWVRLGWDDEAPGLGGCPVGKGAWGSHNRRRRVSCVWPDFQKVQSPPRPCEKNQHVITMTGLHDVLTEGREFSALPLLFRGVT